MSASEQARGLHHLPGGQRRGVKGFNDLKGGICGEAPQKFPYPIFGNCIPHIDVFLENGYTKEEDKMIFETKKILNDFSLKITATTVRVPVYYGHSESINVEFFNPCTAEEVREVLSRAEGVVVQDNPRRKPLPHAVDGGKQRRGLRRENPQGRYRGERRQPCGSSRTIYGKAPRQMRCRSQRKQSKWD